MNLSPSLSGSRSSKAVELMAIAVEQLLLGVTEDGVEFLHIKGKIVPELLVKLLPPEL